MLETPLPVLLKLKVWLPSDEILELGTNAVREHYALRSKEVGYPIQMPLSAYESIAEKMIGLDKAEAAIELLEEGLTCYSHSPRIVFYLVIALARSNRRDEARQRLVDALGVDRPGNNRLQQLLRQLSD